MSGRGLETIKLAKVEQTGIHPKINKIISTYKQLILEHKVFPCFIIGTSDLKRRQKKTIEIHKIISDNCMQHILDQAALGILVWRKHNIIKSTSRCFNEWTIVVEWIEIGLTDTVSFHTTTKNILFSSTEVRAYLIFE